MTYHVFRVHQGENRAISVIGTYATWSEAMVAGMDSGVPAYDVATVDFDTYNDPDVSRARAIENCRASREAENQQAQLPELFRR